MTCSHCGTNLPVDSNVCPKCGRSASVATQVATLEPGLIPVRLFCPQCGASLPDDSDCLKCKRESRGSATVGTFATVSGETAAASTQPRAVRRPHGVFWFLLVLMMPIIGAVLWVVISTNLAAREFRDSISGLNVEEVVDSAFTVKPRTFSPYKLSVPAGISDAVVSGQFNTAAITDQQIEVFVFSESGFVTWQNGYSTTTYYESGKVQQGKIDASLPSAAGIYYVVFSNKSSGKAPITIRATVSLRYNKWMPNWLVHLKDTFWVPHSDQ
jgi:Double zinc ribbon